MDHVNHASSCDVAIIGAGPVGLFSVFACGMMKLRCCVIDTLPHAGGQCQELYPEKPIYDIPGFPTITGADLIQQLLAQAQPFRPAFHLGETVLSVARHQEAWQVRTDRGTVITAKAIIIAAGAGAFAPHKPPLDHLEAFEGTSVFYAVTDPKQFSGKHVVIAGGGDSAVDWAISLCAHAQSVSLVHRRNTWRAAPESIERLQTCVSDKKITLFTPYQLASLKGDSQFGTLSHIAITSLQGEETVLPADVLLAFFGLKTQLGPLESWHLTLEKKKIVVDPTTCKTNQDGIYAVGDIASYPHKRTLILTGFAEAGQAAAAIYRQLNPEGALPFGHSTTRGIPTLS
ncbi:NAD(P)/FAD-dependent oxidoreductase [Candidatus Hepatobacter penaei]|uniref:NAD(P)/FAD-dependent oxidoreductase n=1 Tax=Candidatus Hepatobacter penaei TaxID=1274402 RepID=UPI000A6A14BE|nr:NAD(P)/FAD-dependent oxidoreductase [Candidatus Hepatobacter penaei]TGW15299.1 NAD(P)/FAD-dependent oxidoreductase [bacterium NHP-B]